MYLEYFQLQNFPFTLTPNLEYFCDLAAYKEALNTLLLSIYNGEGFVKIVGEVGSGKTLLTRKLLEDLKDNFVTAYILPNPNMDEIGLYKAILRELEVPIPEKDDQDTLAKLLNEKLIALYSSGKRIVLIIDEVQVLPDRTLEALRLLSNLETASHKLLQIVLFAQPELELRLRQRSLRQLKQRIVFSYHLRPLKRHELDVYLKYRLRAAGYDEETNGRLFSRRARNMLHKASAGIPRVINILSHKALLVAYGRKERNVKATSMWSAIWDTEGVSLFTKSHFYYLAYVLMILLIITFVIELFIAFGNHL
jgi:MSHA biogenesis protein MshM